MRSELDGWKFCPRCGGTLARNDGSVACSTCGLVHYAKPAPAICAVVEDGEGRILLGRRAGEPRAGFWDVLGGFMAEGEQPFATLARELREETGLEVEPVAFLAAIADTYGNEGGHTFNVCWTARVVAGKPLASDDVAELRWFSPDDMPAAGEFAFENGAEFVRIWLLRRAPAADGAGVGES
jgi:ADP-ribose pyrophosphatase YjhB (NUDIX family)